MIFRTKTLSFCYSNHQIAYRLQQCNKFQELTSIHATMIKTISNQDSFFMNQFITACSRLHQTNYAFLMFAQMAEPNAFVYNAVLGGLVQHLESSKAIRLYIDMLKSSVSPTSFTFSYLIKACSQVSALGLGEAIHGQIRKTGFGSQLVVQTGLVDFYSTLDKIMDARRVFDEMLERDVVAWTVMLFTHARVGDMDSARTVFDYMPQRSTVSWNTIIAGYARLGDVEMAACLFDTMPNKDLVSWTTMITCYSQNKRYKEAIEAFKRMTEVGVSPDEVTMTTTISACAHLGALEVGRELHLFATLNGFTLDVYIGSALVDMYAKCGSIEKALLVFYKLVEKNLFCWNSIIEGLAAHGRAKEALDMFYKMKMVGEIKPNGVSFLSVLSACTHGGLVEEGRHIFSSMIDDYLISPAVEHYGCMVDLLARAGLLKEALCLIQCMKIEPNCVIWAALLSGCKTCGNLEIAEVAMRELLVLDPSNTAHYMLLVNMYAETRRWAEVEEVRRAMKGRGVEKRGPGCSWVEIDRVVHEFAACDFSHPSSDDIVVLLVELDGQLRLAGYLPRPGLDISQFM
ncbi:pentatricopeptide repeat-containing protein At1g06143 [Typha angustifolia]|uniref:pentatricopeptide repeat-containing protein At1g06143 n=1 Tax=Typha angustifolia TaxID=59011 RepID=UPI003C2FB69B